MIEAQVNTGGGGACGSRRASRGRLRSLESRAIAGSGRVAPFLGLLLLAAARVPASEDGAAAPSAIERLREMEQRTIELIERSRPAFIFIAGGSGFCISPDGYVLTNEHVVMGARDLVVFLASGRPMRADAVGHDPQGDVALLKIRGAENLPYLEFGDSHRLEIGQPVLALGDPFLLASANLFLTENPFLPPDYEPSASLGIVSALHRYSDTYSDAIQVDLSVNRGNSGGPLLTFDGKVVGINGKIETRFALGINTGVGYAIPSHQILRFLEPLKKAGGGQVRHGTIGGLQVGARVGEKAGLPVTEVLDDSPAFKAGFRPGDLLLSIAGLPVKTATRFHGILSTYPAGESVPVQVSRGDEVLDISAVLVAPGRPFLGILAESAGGDVPGARVTRVDPGTPAERAGLAVGDIVTRFGGDAIGSPTDLAASIRKRSAGDLVVLTVVRGGDAVEIQLRLGGKE
ncbi:MAG: PDZ domain-containing protein [Planctomycetes bacterium]|nr:PDZ domain-containing protein [Planctomycetota bacterium]